jgi:hypothetical protein
VATLQTEEILQGFYWAPVVEVKNPDAFLTKKMYGLLEAGNVIGVPILMGMTSEEGIAWNQSEYNFKPNRDSTMQNCTQMRMVLNLNWQRLTSTWTGWYPTTCKSLTKTHAPKWGAL